MTDYKKLIIIAIALLILWGSFLWFAINYSEDLRNHPCDICADKIGKDVTCYAGQISTIFEGTKEREMIWDKENS